MNFLAHAYLSFGHPELLAGNMISDFVKGKRQFDYPEGIYRGIRLHRAIDEFTDTHPSTKIIRDLFRPHYRLYSAAFADVVYDFFLANDTGEFANDAALRSFTDQTYQHLDSQYHLLPTGFQQILMPMKENNWLFHYKYEWGIKRSFNGIVRRASYLDESDIAFDIFMNNREILQETYLTFFPSVKRYAHQTMERLLQPE